MVTVANDPPGTPQRLPSAAPGTPTTAALASHPALTDCEVHLPAGADPVPLRRVTSVRSAAGLGRDLGGHLVAVRSGTLGTPSEVVTRLAEAGAAALVVVADGAQERAAWITAATQRRVTLVLAPGPAVADQVAEAVSETILDHHATLLEREDEVHRFLVRIVLGGGSLRDLCESLATFFGGAAVVTTTDGRVLASAGVDGELDRALALPCFDRTGRLVVEDEPVGVRSPGRAGHDRRALVRIVAGSSDHGLLAVFCPGRQLTATDVHMLERAATVAALAITKEQAVAAVESKYRSEFLRDVLSQRAGSAAEAVTHAASLGWDLGRPVVVVVAETDEDDDVTTRSADEVRALQERFVRAFVQAVRARDSSVPVAGFSREVVALLPVPEGAGTETVMRIVGEICKVVRGDGGGGRRTFSTGVSRPTTIESLATAYRDAQRAVSVGRQMHGESALTHVDGLGIFRLLALIPDSEDLRAFVEESLGELASDDAPEHADLRRTLAVLLDTNMNVAETARQMFFHYNTLRYRIVKLERMLGPITTDPQLRLTLALALKVREMRGI